MKPTKKTPEQIKRDREADRECEMIEKIYQWWNDVVVESTLSDKEIAKKLDEEFDIPEEYARILLAENLSGNLDKYDMLNKFAKSAAGLDTQ